MAEADPALLRRAEAAERKREAFATLMRDIYAYAMPERDAWKAYGYGAQRNVRVYDSTAVIAAGRFANRLQQALFPPQQRWAMLALPPEMAGAMGAGDVARDLAAATDMLFAHIHGSNFDQVINEWALDLAAGVGCLLVENGRRATSRPGAPLLRFQAVPSALVAFDDGPFGTVEGVFFSQKIPGRLLARLYPDATPTRELARRIKDKPEEEVALLQATVFDAERGDWAMHVILREEREVIAKRRYRTCPWIITRWSKSPGEAHGRGPLAAALPDIRVLNKLMELYLRAASFQVTPAYTATDDGVVNPATVRLAPGAIIPVRSNGGVAGPSLRPLDGPANFALSNDLAERLRTAIRQTLFDDPLPPEVQVGLTATEVAERVRRFQQDTGAFGRLQADALSPLVTRCLDIMEEAGAFAEERFQGLMQAVRDEVVRIRAVSPLALAQDRADLQAVMGFIQGAAALGPVGAAVLERGIHLDRAAPWIASRAHVPPELIPTERELAERAAAAERQRQAETALASPVLAQAVGNLAPALTGQAAP
ncbi:portal protein [Rubritepida flocculans]|uniref:portal protein n=1 Tax=Rubritepida flocculans TaxID=182403 RepID=UPI00040CB054|nr:portal protein [Rubritepida flocculans]